MNIMVHDSYGTLGPLNCVDSIVFQDLQGCSFKMLVLAIYVTAQVIVLCS